MFSIAAINDTESVSQWEPLAPTKEAQEFHLSQTYHEGLLKLEAKDYKKARELLEVVLKDPLVANSQVDSNSSDGHLLQLRFLALKNLATVFLQQGAPYYKDALQCYLQAVEIDNKDSVVWNKLGTLACSIGMLSISRWAFEQGLYCSPNNWNCMEKLLEVLIAIGDEVACLSVAELILRNWPSHSRALLVKRTIEESEPISFAPRGIDKLEPKHMRLKFPEKRKAAGVDLDEEPVSKKLKQNLEFYLSEVSWTALASELLKILHPSIECGSELGPGNDVSGDVSIIIKLSSIPDKIRDPSGRKDISPSTAAENISVMDFRAETGSVSRENESSICGEHPQERRSSRLERLRSRKPDKEELDFETSRDLTKVVMQFLGPYVVNQAGLADQAEDLPNSQDTECRDVVGFVLKTTRNHGAYHLGHMLLEEVARRGILYQDGMSKFLDLEKVIRFWGQERTPECNLFLAELYYDFGLCSSDTSKKSSFLSEASYHVCKIIECVALDYPFHVVGRKESASVGDHFQSHGHSEYPLNKNHEFWVRFFWLSGQLSLSDGDKARAREEFSISVEHLTNKESKSDFVLLSHLKSYKRLTVNKILHEIHLLEVDFLMKDGIHQLVEKNLHSECVKTLAPLLFSSEEVSAESSHVTTHTGRGLTSIELSALDILIKGCEETEPLNIEVYLNCHKRKLQMLITAVSEEENQFSNQMKGSNMLSISDTESKEIPSDLWNMAAQEVKAISQCASRIKSITDPSENSNGVPVTVIGDIQSLLLMFMCNVANTYSCKKFSSSGISDHTEQRESVYFIDAVIAFCKLQHLIPNVPIKTQTELIVAIHDMLAEFGVCCASATGEEEEGTFLKLAIKHLLNLDMKLKSNFHSTCKEFEMSQCDKQSNHDNNVQKSEQLTHESHVNVLSNLSNLEKLNVEAGQVDRAEATVSDKVAVERISAEAISSRKALEVEKTTMEDSKNVDDISDSTYPRSANFKDQLVEDGTELSEVAKEELEFAIDNALDQCFYCLYGLNLRSDASYEDDLGEHKNTSRGDYQTKEQCADVFQYILPYAKASSRTGLIKLRRVLRAIRKHFPQPPDDVLAGNAIDKFLDGPEMCEDKLSEEAGSSGFLESMTKILLPDPISLEQQKASSKGSSEPYLEVYSNLYYLLALSEEMNATDKWAGFVLTKEGAEFVQQNAKLIKYDLIYNLLRLESWQKLANIYDEEVDLLLNDGSKQINVLGWRKNAALSERVEASRRRSRRCLLMTSALAKTADQQAEIHELLALVYYDGLQNVVPIYDQRYVVPSKDSAWMMFCQNSLRHFHKAFAHKEDWSHAFYLGKLSEKLGYSHETSFSFYAKAIALNPSAADSFYRMHASRLKLLCTCRKQDEEALRVVAAYCFNQPTQDTVMDILSKVCPSILESTCTEDRTQGEYSVNDGKGDSHLEGVWQMLYSDCLSALEICVEGDLKHFHKARYMLAQGLYRRGGNMDIQKAKDELSFCFKSSRSSFTINMWEIDSTVKKGRRRTQGCSGNKRALEVNLAESSRKFITCIRKYILFYLKLLEETGDICTLDRAYFCLRTDKRFSSCLEDLIPVALGRYLKALISSIHQSDSKSCAASNSSEHHLEKMFSLFMEQVTMWSDICCLPEIKSSELTESCLFGYLYRYIQSLEQNIKVETLEGINEKIRKRLKNPKLSSSNCAKVHKHVSAAWCRSLVISMALITPLHSRLSSEVQGPNSPVNGLENSQLLCVDLQLDELWCSSFEDMNHVKDLERKWNPSLSKIKNVIVKRAADEDLETASMLLRSCYNFYKDTYCALLPSGINLYMVPSQFATETYIQPGIDAVDILDMNTSRKLILWAYTLLHGHCTSVSASIKYCEENSKSRIKKGSGSMWPSSANASPATASNIGVGKDGMSKSSEPDGSPLSTLGNAPYSEADGSQKGTPPSLPETEKASASFSKMGGTMDALSLSLPDGESTTSPNAVTADKRHKVLLAAPHDNPVVEVKELDMQNDTEPGNI
ncbi:calcineurin-binding protein 1 [Solanum lycopersicum]|uniref:calcineurin-binding protein 1 n=1 Tax=Solanum lycopersicum TaxID=4081 RepID=UPI0037478D94